jgi:hypothetical protein
MITTFRAGRVHLGNDPQPRTPIRTDVSGTISKILKSQPSVLAKYYHRTSKTPELFAFRFSMKVWDEKCNLRSDPYNLDAHDKGEELAK